MVRLIWSALALLMIATQVACSENFISGYPAKNQDGTVNVVIEIPTGSVQKWEINKSSGALEWEVKNGQYRKIRYLGYPANYGMVPRTIMSAGTGGDGDPLDILVLGAPISRGQVVPVTIIGIIRLKDKGEEDDKLIAVPSKGPFSTVRTIPALKRAFPGVIDIIQIWFQNYKGAGVIKLGGTQDRDEAVKVLDASIAEYLRLKHK